MKQASLILIAGIFLSILIRGVFIFTSLEVGDVKNMHDSANMLLSGINPYSNSHLFPYPPLWLFAEAATATFTNLTSFSFHFLIKFWPNLADIFITILIFKFLRKQQVKPAAAAAWSLIYILNPVSIIISSAHGQIDSIVTLLTILSIYLANPLFLGMAIAFKAYPAMLLPLFLVNQKTLSQRFKFLALVSLPTILTLLPFLKQNFTQTISAIFGYSGVYDFGYGALLRGLWFQINAQYWLPVSPQLLASSKLAFLIGAVLLYLLFAGGKNLIKGCLAIYLLFFSFYFGLSAQYFTWVLPLAILLRDKTVILFTTATLIAYLGFYLFFAPELLLGKYFYLAGGFYQHKYMPLYFFGNLILWATTLFWLFKILKEEWQTFKTFSRLRKRAVFVVLLLFLISLIPILKLTLEVIQASTS